MNRKKLNIFDIVVIVVIIAAAVGLTLYFTSGSDSPDNQIGDTVTYVLEVGSTTQETADAIAVGDELVDVTTKNSLGTVTDIDIRPAEELNISYDIGEYIISAIPDKVKVLVTVEVGITETPSEILADGVLLLKVSQSYSVQGPGYNVYASITNITRGDN